MPSHRAAAIVLAACFGLAACGQCGASTTAPNGGGQNLVFSGPAAGTLTTAKTGCEIFTASTQLNYLLTGTLGGKQLTFNIQVNSGYKGPGDYPVGSILDSGSNLRLQIGDYVGSSTTGAGTLTIDKDERSGSVDAALTGGEHVKGSFRCDQVKTE